MGRRIGIFGATFDPPHYGHLTAAEFSRTALKLDEVMMIPASRNPLKLNHIPAPDNIRLKMTAAAIEGNPDFTVNDIEIRRGGLSFMADTLKEIKYKLRDDDRLLLLIGADTAADFKLWKSPFEIIKLTELVVFNRPGFDSSSSSADLPKNIIKVEIPLMEISSTMIRKRIQQGLSIRYLTPDRVIEIINNENLYIA